MGIARIWCYFGRHVRSRGRARRTDYGWHSYCRRCGIEMIKDDGGDWIVVDPPEPSEASAADGAGIIENAVPERRSRLARLFRRKRPA